MQYIPRVSGLVVRKVPTGHKQSAQDAYDLDAEFGPRQPRRKTADIPMILKRRNTTGTMDKVVAHVDYLAPKYAGPGLSYRRAPFQNINDRETTAPSKKPKAAAVVSKRTRPATNQRPTVPPKKVTERKRSVAECRGRRTIKKPVRYVEEFEDPPSSVASSRKSKRLSKENDSGLAITVESDSESELEESIKLWLARNRTPPMESDGPVPSDGETTKRDEIKQWLEGDSGPPKPDDEVSIDSMEIRGGGVSDSEDEAPVQAVVTSTPKTVLAAEAKSPVVATSKSLELRRPQELVPINALASQMVAACGVELKNFWNSFAGQDDKMFSEFAAQIEAAMAQMTENDRKIKMSEMLIAKLRSAMMAQMDAIEKINQKNNALMSSLERSFVENVDDRVSRDAFDSLLNRFVDEAQAQYQQEWKHRKSAIAEKAARFINDTLNN